MQTLERAQKGAADLYWLAFLITGDHRLSMEVTEENLPRADSENGFFSAWVEAWSRRVFLSKVLGSVGDELAASARRTAAKRADRTVLPLRNWVLDGGTTKSQLGEALREIDLFPRCALLLSVFEGVGLEDAAVLLNSEVKLVRKARTMGLRELTCNLARNQGWTPRASKALAATGELQHA